MYGEPVKRRNSTIFYVARVNNVYLGQLKNHVLQYLWRVTACYAPSFGIIGTSFIYGLLEKKLESDR